MNAKQASITALLLIGLVATGCRSILLQAHGDAARPDGSSDSTDHTDVTPTPDTGNLGHSCRTDADCYPGVCGPDGRCTIRCRPGSPDCLSGWYCDFLGPRPICLCTPSPERCNGLDDDCNGLIDDNTTTCGLGGLCIHGVCDCPSNRTLCTGSNTCSDLQTDHANCGACGRGCNGPEACQNGACVCAPTSLNCTLGCIDPQTDPANCGACGVVCASPFVCVAARCSCPTTAPMLCGHSCVDTWTDSAHCGDCTTACAPGFGCAAGRCTCPPSTPDSCFGACVSLANDPMHCGTCDTHCPLLATCSFRRCVCPSNAPTNCRTTCADLQTDLANCGACGHRCPSACEYGECVTIVDVSVGSSEICALVDDGTVRCMECSGACTVRSRFVRVTGLSNVVQLAAGDRFVCARLSDGTVQCWGSNDSGQLGDGSSVPSRVTPGPVTGLAEVVQIAAGTAHACARTRDGSIYCWGDNMSGAIGDGTFTRRSTPVRVTLPAASDIDAGNGHTCAIVAGAVYCWGSNAHGQIGNGVVGTNAPSPTAVALSGSAVQVTAGYGISCEVDHDGQLWCWGRNAETNVNDGRPALIRLDEPVAEARSGENLFVRLRDGRIFAWGADPTNVGAGTYSPTAPRPLRVGALVQMTRVDAGTLGCALDGVGAFWCWGMEPVRLSP